MPTTDVLRKIHAFPRWHYQFELEGHTTPIAEPGLVNRHAQRKRYILPPLLELCGGSLAGKRVLDLGCNAGFWSLAAIEHDCDYVLGIDGRAMHIEQAELVFETRGVARHRYDFCRANVFDLTSHDLGTFDVVFCLGLFYHIAKHVSLLEWIARLNTDVLVIDTNLSEYAGSVLEIRHDALDVPGNACDYELVMFPTRQAMLDLARQFAYQAVVLEPRFSSYQGAEDFQHGSRRAFVCAKRSDLSLLRTFAEAEDRTRNPLLNVPAKVLVKTLFAKLLRRLGWR